MHIVAYHVLMEDENMEFYVDLDGKFEIPLLSAMVHIHKLYFVRFVTFEALFVHGKLYACPQSKRVMKIIVGREILCTWPGSLRVLL
jgi:hypothetical protein